MNGMVVSRLAVFLSAVLWVGVAKAGPYGLSMGMKQSDFKGPLKPVEDKKWTYSTERAPKPDNSVASYKLLISPQSGLCMVEAIGRTIETNPQGTELLQAYYGLRQQLSSMYEKPDWDQNSLTMGSTSTMPDDWTMGLLKGERFLVAAWAPAGHSDDGVTGIVLTAQALDRNHGFLKLKYEFRCYGQLKEELGGDARTVREILDQYPLTNQPPQR